VELGQGGGLHGVELGQGGGHRGVELDQKSSRVDVELGAGPHNPHRHQCTGGSGIGGLAGGIPGAIIGGIAGGAMGAVHGWEMAAAGAYDWDKGADWLEFIADNTWSLPNSFVASIFTTINAPWNPVDKALSQGQGQLVFQKSWAPDYATTFGNVTAGQQVPKHEREHAFQARLFGPIFYPSVAANYVVNIIPWWWGYHKSRYPTAPITSFKEYFTRGVYPHVWAEDWAYKIQGSPQ
jgi:hypothetical protein